MEFKLPHLIVVPTAQSALPTAGTATTDLTSDRFGLFDASTRLSVTGPTFPTNQAIFFAQYSGDNKLGTYKSPVIAARNVTGWRGVEAICSGTNQITYVGFDEVNDDKTLTSECDEYYTVTIRLTNERARHMSPAGFTKSYSVKTICCTDCASPCQTVDCKTSAQAIVDLINADPYMNLYVTASVVSKCTGTPATKVFALTLPDPGTNVGGVATFSYTTSAAGLTNGTNNAVTGTASASGTSAAFDVVVAGNVITGITLDTAGSGYVMGETITIAGTSLTGGASPADDVVITVLSTTGAEGVLLDEIKTMFSAMVDDTDTDIVITADTDGDQDSNSTGNIRIELTASDGVVLSDLQDYNGIKWEEVTLTAGDEECVCGIKIEGNALDEFGNPCVPSAFPHIFDAVKFAVFTSKGPQSTNDFEVYEPCDAWPVTTTQIVTYPIGSGKEYADMEREIFQYYNRVKRNYINPLFNQWTPQVDPDKFYDAYYLTYFTKDAQGFADIANQEGEVIVLFEHECPTDTKTAFQTAFEDAIDAFVAENGFSSVTL